MEFDPSKAITKNQTVYAKWTSNSTQKPSNDSASDSVGKGGCGSVVLVDGGASLLLSVVLASCGAGLMRKKKSAKAQDIDENQQAN